MVSTKLQLLGQLIIENYKDPNFVNCQKIIEAVCNLLNISNVEWSVNNNVGIFGRNAKNLSFLKTADGYEKDKAVYILKYPDNKNIDLKAFWINKISKNRVSWLTALTPNFEDEPIYTNHNIGIDFVINGDATSVTIVLSKNYNLRTLELTEKLTNTQVEILKSWEQDIDFSNKNQLHDILWNSFNLKEVNKKFYQKISELFNRIKQHLHDETKVFEERQAAHFSNRLIGRIIFCWFLNKKGVINTDYKYFEIEEQNSTEHYKQKLEKLFFNVFNTPVEERDLTDDTRTPFLNGGLFEPRKNDLYQNSKLTFPKDFFHEFYDFLSQYNFTTDESTSEFEQIAIDPEMLGRIFENLLASQSEETGEQARKAKGAFYTPREIVDYMCQESLYQYLQNTLNLNFENRDNYLEILIKHKAHVWEDQRSNYLDRIKQDKQNILTALDQLTVIDPACGSGAFPMGMLQLLTRTYERIEPRFDSYKAKLAIIKNNLFGIDIEPMAVEISRLRAWLSIVVDEHADPEKIEPLPNLDFKFICANSLIKLDESNQTGMFDDKNIEQEMQELRDQYYTVKTIKQKKKLREKFDKILKNREQTTIIAKNKRQEQLESFHPFDPENITQFFDPEFMFGIQEGFDIVIGNPPYVQLQKNKGQLANMYQNEGFDTFARTGDIYALFYEKGIQISKKGTGLLCYITSNKWMRAGYGEKLRQFFVNLNPLLLLDLGGEVFESATVDSNILLIENSNNKFKTTALTVNKNKQNITEQVNKEAIKLKLNSNSGWFIGSNLELQIKEKIENLGKPLKDWDVNIYRGILTGLNEAFIIDKNTKEQLIKSDPKNAEIIKPILRGKDIKNYTYEFPDLYLINAHNGYKNIPRVNIEGYPTIKVHLDQFEPKLSARQDKGATPYNLRNCAYLEEFKKEKIIYSEIVKSPQFYFDTKQYYPEATSFIITGEKLKLIYAILNSKFGYFIFKSFYAGGGLGEKGIRYKKKFIENIPIVNTNDTTVNVIEELGLNIQKKKEQDPRYNSNNEEQELNEIIMEIYNLSEIEKKYIRKN